MILFLIMSVTSFAQGYYNSYQVGNNTYGSGRIGNTNVNTNSYSVGNNTYETINTNSPTGGYKTTNCTTYTVGSQTYTSCY